MDSDILEQEKEIILANPQGFCAGVDRAIKVVDGAIELFPDRPICVFHEIVHNKRVLSDFRSRGVSFVESVSEVPDGAVFIISAHGVSKAVEDEAKARNLQTIDASCPLVLKVHREAQSGENKGKEIILIGHKNHAEVKGTMGRVSPESIKIVDSVDAAREVLVKDPKNVCYITQTTLSIDDSKKIIDELKKRFPEIKGPPTEDICYATQNRQVAVKKLSEISDVIFIIGSSNSSNSQRLREVGESCGLPSYLIDNYTEIDEKWLEGKKKVGISSGASAPQILVDEVVKFLKEKFNFSKSLLLPAEEEKVKFVMPKELR